MMQSPRTTRPEPPAPFEWLYDGLPEDGIQEYAHLRADLAENLEDAAAEMTRIYERDQCSLESGAHFVAVSKDWLRGSIDVYLDDVDDPTETLIGSVAERHAQMRDRLDELFYVRCGPDDEGAREFWRCNVAFTKAAPDA